MADAVPNPAPSPPPPTSQPSISAEINAATRKQHTELNRLIIKRLPLALPPNAASPELLGRGVAAFAEIFFAFETVWHDMEGCQKTHEEDDLFGRVITLRPTGLERSERLDKDLMHIMTITGVDVTRDLPLAESMNTALAKKPHLLVAYAWVMYMAIFSGGRWIRQLLADAGPEFWSSQHPRTVHGISDHQLVETPGFSFLFFDGEEDGEDIKRTFKARLVSTEALLSPQQRREVVEEAERLFEYCIALVHGLDRTVARQRALRVPYSAILLTALLSGIVWLYYTNLTGISWR